jgi:hypothetical protein
MRLRVKGVELWVQGVWFGMQGSGFRHYQALLLMDPRLGVSSFGFWVYGLGFGVHGLVFLGVGLRVSGLGVRVQGLGLRV